MGGDIRHRQQCIAKRLDVRRFWYAPRSSKPPLIARSECKNCQARRHDVCALLSSVHPSMLPNRSDHAPRNIGIEGIQLRLVRASGGEKRGNDDGVAVWPGQDAHVVIRSRFPFE